MLKDTIRPNGTIKRIQYVKAFRGGTSSMGTPYKKGDAIVHLSSSRCTGETFVLLPKEMLRILGLNTQPRRGAMLMTRPGRWNSPKWWSEQMSGRWNEVFEEVYGHTFATLSKCNHTHGQHEELAKKMSEILKKRV